MSVESRPLWSLCTVNDDVLPDSTAKDYSFDYVDISSVTTGLVSPGLATLNFGEAPSRARRLAREGDVIVSTVRTYLKAIAPVGATETDRVYSTGFAVLRPDPQRMNAHFFKYALLAEGFIDQITAHSVGVSYPAINASDLMRFAVPTPSLSAQRRIADYLDRETAEIDAMDAELDRLVETLRERKAASLDIAVTTADRSVALAWATSVIATGPFGTQVRQGDYEAGGTPLINPSHIRNGSVFPDERVAVGNQKAVELRRHMMDEGDIVVARRGDLGRCAVISSSQIGFLCGTGSLRVVPNPRLLEPRYAALAISSRGSRAQMLAYSVGATMDNLNEVLLGRVQIALPPLDAQRRIVAELDEQTARIDDMIADAQRLKALLAKRRSTLITEVVTGRKEVPA